MRVSRIEIFGFKSFMERLNLPLNSGITGVVGPNGCGKSNVVDALRWVLGETNARNLRGTVSEDVIFNGTEKLRPLGLAEVTITLKASGSDFFSSMASPSSEAESLSLGDDVDSVLKAIDRKNDSAEQMAAEALDLKDQPENADEPGIEGKENEEGARPKLTVIEGRKGHPVTEPLPEVASSITATDALANRFSWLKSASEVQITRRLYRSGESEYFINRVACRLRDITDLCRAVGLGARTYTIVAQGQVARIVSAKPEERRTILEEAAGVLGFRDKIAAANRRLKETDINVERLTDVINEVSRNVSSLGRQASRAKNRERLKVELSQLLKEVHTHKLLVLTEEQSQRVKEQERFSSEESLAQTELQRIQASEMEARSKLMGIDVESDALRARIDAIREELSNRERERHQRGSRLAELGVLCSSKLSEKKETEARIKLLEERLSGADSTIEELGASAEGLERHISSLDQTKAEEIKQIHSELSGMREMLKAKEREISARRDEIVAARSVLASVEEQIRAASPEAELKRTIGDDFKSLAGADSELFVDGLDVPAKYVRAVQALVAERAAYLVTSDPENLALAFSGSEVHRSESVFQGRALGLFKTGQADLAAPASLDSTKVQPLLNLIKVKESHQLAAKHLFSEAYVAEDLSSAYEFLKSRGSGASCSIVTLQGEIVNDISFTSIQLEGGLLQLKAKISELKVKMSADQEVQLRLDAEKEVIISGIAALEQRQSDAVRRSEERSAKIRELSHEQGNVRGRLASEERLREQITEDIRRTKEQVARLESELSNSEDESIRLQGELDSDVGEVEKELQNTLVLLKNENQRLNQVRDAGREELSKYGNLLADQRQHLDRSRAALSQVALELQRAELEISHLRERVIEDLGDNVWIEMYNLEPSLLSAARLSESDYLTKDEELNKLKARIQREGDVDPSSIERFEEESTRLENLTAQRKDLEEASSTLRKTIKRLSEISEQRFLHTFSAVNENFGKLVPRLYGGGNARLELLDPANPLESGVEIAIRPPGKKLKNIELMSGGEKALCAIALIVAMFLERPSPLCILDEVDAPLDDANVVRFLTLIKEMSTKTQFILITHNKQSMQICDRLVGVTMQEPGASKVVTVSLEEAFKHAAVG